MSQPQRRPWWNSGVFRFIAGFGGIGGLLFVLAIGAVLNPGSQQPAGTPTATQGPRTDCQYVAPAFVYSLSWRTFPPSDHQWQYQAGIKYCTVSDAVPGNLNGWVDFASTDGATAVTYKVTSPKFNGTIVLLYQADRPVEVATVTYGDVKLVPVEVTYFALPFGASLGPDQAFELTHYFGKGGQTYAMSDIFGDTFYVSPRDVAFALTAGK